MGRFNKRFLVERALQRANVERTLPSAAACETFLDPELKISPKSTYTASGGKVQGAIMQTWFLS